MYEIITSNSHITLTRQDVYLLTALVLWELAWKGIALWKAGRNRQLAWFIVILFINTGGLLEIIYILFFQREKTKE